MKKLIYCLLGIMLIISCTKEENDLIEPNPNLIDHPIVAKWLVEGDSDYRSFEFNGSGTYLIVKNIVPENSWDEDYEIIYGTYTIIDDTTFELSDFGQLTVSNLDDEFIQIDLLGQRVLQVSKQNVIDISSDFDMLFNSWKVVTMGYRGRIQDVSDDEVVFILSKTGEYTVLDKEGYNMGWWKLKDLSKNEFFYSITYKDPYWRNDENYWEIIELTNTKLVMHDYDSPDDPIILELELITP